MPLYTSAQRHEVVRRFIDAYLGGSVKIVFPTEDDTSGTGWFDKLLGRQADSKLDVKEFFSDMVDIATGAEPATASQVQTIKDMLFGFLINVRIGERIVGQFYATPNLESRVASVETRTSEIERLLEELQNLMHIRGQGQ
jgi:hypothetical protein